MADMQRLLGTMMATGLAGRSRRGPAFAASPFGGAGFGGRPAMAMSGGGMGGLGKMAGLGALGYLAYKAFQERQANQPSSSGGAQRVPPQSSGRAQEGPSLGERLAGILQPQKQEPEPAAEATLGDQKALLLIRAMIAAANADGEISAEERSQIVANLEKAEAGPEERAVLERELARPRSVDEIAREVRDEETAVQVYVASRIAMNPDTPAEQAYMQYLATRLNLPADRVEALNAAT